MALLQGQYAPAPDGGFTQTPSGAYATAQFDSDTSGCDTDCGCTCCPACLNEFYLIDFSLTDSYDYQIQVANNLYEINQDSDGNSLTGGYCGASNVVVCNMPYPLYAELTYGRFGRASPYASTSTSTSTGTSTSTSSQFITLGTTSTSTQTNTSTTTTTSTSTSVSSSGTFEGSPCEAQIGYDCTFAVGIAFEIYPPPFCPICGCLRGAYSGMAVYGIYVLEPATTTATTTTSTSTSGTSTFTYTVPQCGQSPAGTYALYCSGVAGVGAGVDGVYPGFQCSPYCGANYGLDTWIAIYGTTSTSSATATTTHTSSSLATSTTTFTLGTSTSTRTNPYITTSTNTQTSTSTSRSTSMSFVGCEGGIATPNLNCVGYFGAGGNYGYASYLAAADILDALPAVVIVTNGGGIYGFSTSTSWSTITSKTTSTSTSSVNSTSNSTSTSTSTWYLAAIPSTTTSTSTSAVSMPSTSCNGCAQCSSSYVVTANCNGGSTSTNTSTIPARTSVSVSAQTATTYSTSTTAGTHSSTSNFTFPRTISGTAGIGTSKTTFTNSLTTTYTSTGYSVSDVASITTTYPSSVSYGTITQNTGLMFAGNNPYNGSPLGLEACAWFGGEPEVFSGFTSGFYSWSGLNTQYLVGYNIICGSCVYNILWTRGLTETGCPDDSGWGMDCYYPLSGVAIPYGSSTSTSTGTNTYRSTSYSNAGTSTSTTTIPYLTTTTVTGSTASTASTFITTSKSTSTSASVSTSTTTSTKTNTATSTSVSSSWAAAGTYTFTQSVNSTSSRTNTSSITASCTAPPSVVIVIVPATSSSSSGPILPCGDCIDCSTDPPTNSAGALSDTYVASFTLTYKNDTTGLITTMPVSATISYINDGSCTWSGAQPAVFPTSPGVVINVFLTNPGDLVNPCVFRMSIEVEDDSGDTCQIDKTSPLLSCLFVPTTPAGSYTENQECFAFANVSGVTVA